MQKKSLIFRTKDLCLDMIQRDKFEKIQFQYLILQYLQYENPLKTTLKHYQYTTKHLFLVILIGIRFFFFILYFKTHIKYYSSTKK